MRNNRIHPHSIIILLAVMAITTLFLYDKFSYDAEMDEENMETIWTAYQR